MAAITTAPTTAPATIPPIGKLFPGGVGVGVGVGVGEKEGGGVGVGDFAVSRIPNWERTGVVVVLVGVYGIAVTGT